MFQNMVNGAFESHYLHLETDGELGQTNWSIQSYGPLKGPDRPNSRLPKNLRTDSATTILLETGGLGLGKPVSTSHIEPILLLMGGSV